MAALQGNPGNAAYAASKGALVSYCRTLAIETAKRGITVNTVASGFIDTDMMAPYAAYWPTWKSRSRRPLRQARGDRGLAAFLMSDTAAYITGAVLPVDGGLTSMIGVHRGSG